MNANKIKKSVIREDLLAITGDYRKAIILNQFIYWSERVADADKFIEKENEIAQSNGEETRELFYGWIYKSAEEMADEIMLGLSASQVRKYIGNLVDMGYLSKRNNPKYKWDRTLQYRVNLVNIARDLKEKGYPLSDYKIAIPDSAPSNTHQCAINGEQSQNQTHSDDEAIPEITTENTYIRDYHTEITDINASVPDRTEDTPYLNMDNCTSDEIKNHYVIRCRRIAKKHNITDHQKIDGVVNTIEYFCRKYYETLGEHHPVLSDRALERVFINFCFPPELLYEFRCTDFDAYKEMIDRYFMTEYGKYQLSGVTPDYSISHFMSEQILINLCKNAFNIPHL